MHMLTLTKLFVCHCIFYDIIKLIYVQPTSACDQVSQELVEKAIIESGVTAIIVTHDPLQAERLCHRRVILQSRFDAT